MTNPRDELIDRLEQMGRAGFMVSICCGPCGSRPFAWSVQVLSPTGEEFDRPYLAESFAHAIAIAALEITRRWPSRASSRRSND